MKTRSLFIVAFVLVSHFINAQKTEKLTVEKVFSSELTQKTMGEIQWLKKNEGFLLKANGADGDELVVYDIKTKSRKTLITANELIPQNAEKPIEVSSYSLSPDESKVLIFTNTERVWRTNTKGDYWVFDLAKKSLFKLGRSLPESSLMFAKFSPDNSKVAYVSESNIYMEELGTGKPVSLTDDGTVDIINGTFDWAYEEELGCKDGFRWNDDGKKIAFWQIDATDIKDFLMINNTDSLYSFTIPVQYPKVGQDPSSAKIGVVDIDKRKTIWMQIPGDPKQNYLPAVQWIPGKDQLLVQQLNRKQNQLKIFNIDAETGKAKEIYEEKEDAWIEMLKVDLAAKNKTNELTFSSDGKTFLLESEKDGWRHIYQLAVDGGKENLLTPGEYDVAAFYYFDEKKNYVYFNASPENAAQRYLYRISLKKNSKPERLTPDKFTGVNLYNFSPDGKYALQDFSNADTPASERLAAMPNHEELAEFVSNEKLIDQLKNYDLPKVEFFSLTTADEVEMDARMIKPKDFDPQKKYPVLFYVYGEPWTQTATDTWVGLWNFFLAQQGYIVITMDNRGTPTLKGRDWRKSIYRKIGVVNARDQAMAAQEIIKWKYIDPERVAVWGWSGGGSMTLNLLFRYPEIYQTGMSVAAVANQLYYDNIYQERYMGLPWENPQDFTEGSPITYAKNLEGNLLYIHGTADDNVHYQNAEALINELVAQNKQFDLMIYPNRSHSINEGVGTTIHLYRLLYRYLSEHTPPGGRPQQD